MIEKTKVSASSMPDGKTYAEAVGAFLRTYRADHGITLDAIARLAREFGATWSASSVNNIQNGQASLTLPTLLTLALVLGRLSGTPLRLIDLLGSAEILDLPFVDAPDQVALRTWLERALTGDPVELTDADYPVLVHAPGRSSQPGVSLAEDRAANKLGIQPHELQRRASHLWGHSLETEAFSRAGADSTPQARGRISRHLIDKIQESMKEGV